MPGLAPARLVIPRVIKHGLLDKINYKMIRDRFVKLCLLFDMTET